MLDEITQGTYTISLTWEIVTSNQHIYKKLLLNQSMYWLEKNLYLDPFWKLHGQ